MNRRSVKNDISFGIGKAKAAGFEAVANIIAKGKIVDYQENWQENTLVDVS